MHAFIAALGLFLAAAAAPADAPGPSTELTSKAWLYEVVRHLYRWHIREGDVDPVIRSGEVIFWVRPVFPQLDQDDLSLFGEVILPQFAKSVHVKKAHYSVPELNLIVKNESYRIVRVDHIEPPPALPEGFTEVRADYIEMRDELFRTRNNAAFPEGELLERLRTGVRAQVMKELEAGAAAAPTGTQVVYLAPLSPIANEEWVFWESGRTLIRFTSDVDLTNPAVWQHDKLGVQLFSLDKKIVVSLDEVAGSNAFMTRDEAGRVIFNCVVLGKRIELQPRAENQP